jgi:hypothetical protein
MPDEEPNNSPKLRPVADIAAPQKTLRRTLARTGKPSAPVLVVCINILPESESSLRCFLTFRDLARAAGVLGLT